MMFSWFPMMFPVFPIGHLFRKKFSECAELCSSIFWGTGMNNPHPKARYGFRPRQGLVSLEFCQIAEGF